MRSARTTVISWVIPDSKKISDRVNLGMAEVQDAFKFDL